MTTKILILGAALCALTACGESRHSLNAARAMSCTQLARELGKHEQRSASAGIDSMVNTITGAFTDDNAVERQAAIDGLINDVDQADANRSIEQLTAVFNAKGCA